MDSTDTALWMPNTLETSGFRQTYSGPTADIAGTSAGSSTISCAMTSDRATVHAGHDYKISQKIKVRAGYKIRESKDALTSLQANDGEDMEFTIEGAYSSVGFYAGALTMAIASMLAF